VTGEQAGWQSLFLDSTEDNRPIFVAAITRALRSVPMPPSTSPDEPYVSGPIPDSRWLDSSAAIPDVGANQDVVLERAMQALRGQMRWHAPTVLHNITQPVALPVAAAHAVTSLYNPNALWDLVSGGFLDVERQLTAQIGDVIGWAPEDIDGLVTFGGKSGIISALRLGLNRCVPGISRTGFGDTSPVVITTDQNHYSILSAASLLGLGTENVFSLPTAASGQLDVGAFVAVVEGLARESRPLACIVLCGGNTLDGVVDPIRDVVAALDEVGFSAQAGYRPWIHLDLPLGWPYLLFRGYDFAENPLAIPAAGCAATRAVLESLNGSEAADSSCVDFHKMGFCPYGTSLFLTRHAHQLRSIFRDESESALWGSYGSNFRQHYSIEHSRSAAPIAAAWVALQVIGKNGFRSYLGNLHWLTDKLRTALASNGEYVMNPRSPSLATMVVPTQLGVAPCAAAALDLDALHEQNLYTESLFRHLLGLDGRQGPHLAVGFVPEYRAADTHRKLAALRFYLINPVLTNDHLVAAVDRYLCVKERFDRTIWPDEKQNSMVRINHTPR
jgi:L-2,4-diaminobutyrate decarboxylase